MTWHYHHYWLCIFASNDHFMGWQLCRTTQNMACLMHCCHHCWNTIPITCLVSISAIFFHEGIQLYIHQIYMHYYARLEFVISNEDENGPLVISFKLYGHNTNLCLWCDGLIGGITFVVTFVWLNSEAIISDGFER